MRSWAKEPIERTRISTSFGAAVSRPPPRRLQTAILSKIWRSSSWKMITIATMKTAKKPWKIQTVMDIPMIRAKV